MAIVSYGTITITDTNDIESIVIEYARNQSSSSAPESGWSTNRPAWAQGYYIWQRTRTHKAGTDASKDTYGTAVCITGSTGATGATGQSLSSTKTQYTNVASNVTITTSNHTSYTWTDNVPAYNSSKPAYWARITNTYTNPAKTEYLVYKDQGITDAIKTSNDANTTANAANQVANQTQTNLTNYISSNNANITALQSRLKRIWINENTSGDYVAGTYAASGIDGTTFSESNPQTYGYNTLLRHNMLALRYNTINMTALTTNALTFYVPTQQNGNWVQGKKGLEITSSGLSLYNPSNDSISMMDLTSSGLIFKTSAGTEIGKFGSDSSGGLLELSGRLNIKGGGRIGQDSDNYWEFGDNKSYNDEDSAYLIGKGTASIQLGEAGHWRIDSNRIHTGWYQLSDSSSSTPAGSLHFDTGTDDGSTYYWDYGMHYPDKAGGGNNKFLYIRRSNDTTSTTLKTMKGRIDDDTWWTYKFWVDGSGNVHAPGFYIGDSTTPIGGGAGTVAERLTQGYGNATQPVYFDNNGTPTITTYQLNAAGAKGVVTDIASNTSSTNLPTTAAVVSYVTSRGYVTTDKNVQTSQANTTKIYLAGTSTTGDNVGTLNYDSNVYLTTTAGTLHATTFDGTTFTGTAAKATNDSDGNKISTTYLKLSGGTVSGEVEFGSAVSVNDEFYADSITVGNLIVNGAGRFTNGLYGDLTGNVTGSITGNAATADKVNHNLVIKLASGTTEGTNMFTFNGSAAKTVDITKSALGLGNVENKSSATIRGELTSANVTTALGFTPYDSTNPNGYTSNIGTITGVTAGTGLSGGGTSGAVTLNHSNSITAQTTQGIYPIKIDAQGHISAYGSAPTTLSGYGITDAKIANGVITLGSNTITPLTSQWTANLYVGKTATDKANAAATNGNVYLNLVENNTVRNAHKITGSGTTTVISDADGNITISSADSKVGTVTSITLTQGTGISIGSSGTAITTSGSRTISLADNYGDTKNPYASKTARYVLAAPADAAGVPSFRALTGADVGLGNVLNAAQVTGIGQGADGKIRVYKGDSNYEDVAVEIVATESSSVASAQKLTSYGGSTKQPVYFPNSGTNAGKPVAIGYTIETSVPSGAVFTDTTYTFAGSTNGFTVTPLNGTAQTITVTPSIANNITGSGTSGYLAKFNGANTITNGPALGTDTTKFLNNKGEWSVPTNTNTTYILTNALASHKFTWTFTAGGSGSGSTTTIAELAAGTGISLTDDATNKKITIGNSGVTGVKGNSEGSYRTGQVNLTPANIGAVDKTGDTMTGNLTIPASRIANTYYGISYGRTTGTPVETILYTGIKWRSGSHMPVIHVTGYAYGLHSPVEFKIGFYIYNNEIGWCGATNMGSWAPDIYLFKYIKDEVEYVAVGFAGSCYFLQLSVDLQDEMGKFNYTITDSSAWSWEFLTTAGTIPTPDSGVSCIKVPYTANILKPANADSVPWSGVTSRPTTISGYGITDAVLYGGVDTGLGSGTPAATAKTYYSNTAKVPTNSIKMFLNSSGVEYTTLFSNRGSYGSILKWGYNDKYIRILRNQSGTWKSDDWEKIDAGYADTAGTATSAAKWTSAQTIYVTLGTASKTTTLQGGSSSAQTIGVDGTLGVGNGGTGATSFTSGALLIGNGSNAIGTRSIVNNTSIGALGWTGSATTASNLYIPTLNTLAYWNGAYRDTTSNLTYCVKGAFGTATIKDSTTSVASGGTALPTAGAVYTAIRAASDTYVTLTTAQTLTAAATKTYLGLQLYGSQGIGLGTTGTNDAVTQKANVKYDASLEAIVFSFS